MKVDVVNIDLKKVGSLELPDAIFAVTVNEALLWEQVKAQRASRRRGTHDTKTRGEVSGGGAKPYKQKGTGRARQGSSRAPNHVGGGCVFGPHPRDYSYRLPRSGRRSALRSALSVRAQAAQVVVLDEFIVDLPKTQKVLDFLGRLGTTSALLVDAQNDALLRSTRNLPTAKYIEATALNVYDILDYDRLVLTRAAVNLVIAKAQALADDPTATAAA